MRDGNLIHMLGGISVGIIFGVGVAGYALRDDILAGIAKADAITAEYAACDAVVANMADGGVELDSWKSFQALPNGKWCVKLNGG
jgi:hypothetical protein